MAILETGFIHEKAGVFMYKLCKTEQSSARQRELELGLLEVMMQQRYEDITISELCEKLQIPRKAFYRYFSGKDGALFALLDHTMLDFSLTDSLHGSISTLLDLERFFTFWYSQKSLLDALAKSNLSGILVERATALALRERMMPRSFLPLRSETQTIALSFAVCGIMSMVIQWHHTGFLQTPQEMTQLSKLLLTKPLLSV